MKKMATILTIVFALSLFLTGNVLAGDKYTSQGMKMGQHHRASQLIGKDVQNQQGEEVGEISDLMLNTRGNIDFLILSRGDDLVPIPWQAVKQPGAEDALVVNMDKAKLDKAPRFSEKDWAGFNETEYQDEVRGYYGVKGMEGPEEINPKDRDLDSFDVLEGEQKWDPGKNN